MAYRHVAPASPLAAAPAARSAGSKSALGDEPRRAPPRSLSRLNAIGSAKDVNAAGGPCGKVQISGAALPRATPRCMKDRGLAAAITGVPQICDHNMAPGRWVAVAALALALAACAPVHCAAASITWNGTDANAAWELATNWIGGVAPGVGVSAPRSPNLRPPPGARVS